MKDIGKLAVLYIVVILQYHVDIFPSLFPFNSQDLEIDPNPQPSLVSGFAHLWTEFFFFGCVCIIHHLHVFMVFPKLRWSLGSQLLGSDILHVQIWSLWFNEAMRRGSTSSSNANANSGKLRRQMLKQWSLQTLPEELELLLSQKIAG